MVMPGQLEKFAKTYEKSEVVFQENTPGKEMYIIRSGGIKLYKEQAPGQYVLLATLESGDFFGEMSLIDGSPRSATAVVDEEGTRLLELDRNKFLFLLRHQPEFALVVMERLCERLRQANQTIAKMESRLYGVF